MSDRLPYEEQLNLQWNELPLPDENMAWADMKRRLEDDDDAAPVAWWKRGCALWGLLSLLILALGWWLLRPEKWLIDKKRKQEISVQQQADSLSNKNKINEKDAPIIEDGNNENEIKKNVIDPVEQNRGDSLGIAKSPGTKNKNSVNTNETTNSEIAINVNPAAVQKKDKPRPVRNTVKKDNPSQAVSTKSTKTNDQEQNPVVAMQVDKPATDAPEKRVTDEPVKQIATGVDSPLKKTTVIDTVKKSAEPEKPAAKPANRQDSAKKKAIFFSGGISVNQQLPIDGQTATPYNSLGRKGTLLDYIPSVYFRLNKQVNDKDKWFLQAELRYGAPQYAKSGLVYGQVIVPDTGTNSPYDTVTSSVLKKTYYHQLPVTFNYFILPNWSVGGGFVWNKFSSAIAEKEIKKRNRVTGVDSPSVKTAIEKISDSASASVFSKSYFQAVIETQYKWKRFSLGARYAFGLDPYIRFTLPGGTQQQERNSSLQIFLRYELWKSRLRVQKSGKR
jgi:hypothetical protein